MADRSRLVFFITTGISGLSMAFAAGVYSTYTQNSIFMFLKDAKEVIETSISEVKETAITTPKHFLQPTRQSGSGVTVSKNPDDGSLVLLSGFFEDNNELRLIRRDGSVVARWLASYSELFPSPEHLKKAPATDWNIDLHGALAQPDGSVVFNFEYGGLVKLDRCGDEVWKVEHQTHHSVEQAEDGGFWVPGRRSVSEDEASFAPFPAPFAEDLILLISPHGKIIEEISVPGLFYENGLEALLTSTGDPFRPGNVFVWDEEIVHLNKIGVLSSDIAGEFPDFEAGDLIISLRNYNLIMVLDPDTHEVRWWQIGPWIRQHDPEFNADGTVSVFNNNAYRSDLLDGEVSDPAAPRVSNIIRVDPGTGTADVVYGEQEGQEMLSVIRGKHQVLPDGGFFITEFEGGRALQVDKDGTITWEYVNRYDADRVSEISEARVYSDDYFIVSTWSCPDSQP